MLYDTDCNDAQHRRCRRYVMVSMCVHVGCLRLCAFGFNANEFIVSLYFVCISNYIWQMNFSLYVPSNRVLVTVRSDSNICNGFSTKPNRLRIDIYQILAFKNWFISLE